MFRGLFFAGLVAAGIVIAPALNAAPPLVNSLAATSPAGIPMPMSGSGCYYTNCTQAHQSGEGNILQGSDHYCSKQDRDSDGIACEW
jgi:Excalibur calcium-binding domain